MEGEQLIEFQKCNKPVAAVRIVAMASVFIAGAVFVASSDPGEFVLRANAKQFESTCHAIGIAFGILGGFLFATSGFADEMFNDDNE